MERLLCVALLASVFTLAHAQENISKANGNIRVAAQKTVGNVNGTNGNVFLEDGVQAKDVETVNGAITIGRNAAVGAVESVNGGIQLQEGTRARSAATVNGSVNLAERVQIEGAVSATNGGIRLAPDAAVGGGLTTGNGTIKLERASVGGDLRTKSGDIEIGRGSTVKGRIVVEKGRDNWFQTPRVPRVIIESGAVVTGALTFEREVRLYVDPNAQIGPISGVKPIKLSKPETASDAKVEK